MQLEDELDRLVEQQRDLTHQEQGRRQKKVRIQKEIAELRDMIAKNPLDENLDRSLKEVRDKRVKMEEAINRHEQSKSEIGKLRCKNLRTTLASKRGGNFRIQHGKISHKIFILAAKVKVPEPLTLILRVRRLHFSSHS